jgi:hypothetical protein
LNRVDRLVRLVGDFAKSQRAQYVQGDHLALLGRQLRHGYYHSMVPFGTLSDLRSVVRFGRTATPIRAKLPAAPLDVSRSVGDADGQVTPERTGQLKASGL